MKSKFWMIVAVSVMLAGGANSLVEAQDTQTEEIEIVNPDGEAVNQTIVVVRKQESDQSQATRRALRAKVSGQASGADSGGGSVSGSGSMKVRNQNGKITITDGNGNERVLDFPGARGVTVTQSEKTVEQNGQVTKERVGKAIIIGPDGQRHEIDLSGAPGLSGGLPATFRLEKASAGKFMIGVGCAPVSKALTAQLKLTSGVGLIVETVVPYSPAATAGLEQHDILLSAENTELKTMADLIAAVDRAGKESKPISLTVLRGGKEIGFDIKPTARPESHLLESALTGNLSPDIAILLEQANGLDGVIDLNLKQAGPGVIIGSEFNVDDFHRQMQQQMEEMKAEMARMKEMLDNQASPDK